MNLIKIIFYPMFFILGIIAAWTQNNYDIYLIAYLDKILLCIFCIVMWEFILKDEVSSNSGENK